MTTNNKVAVKTLQNGLKILVKQDNRAPVAVLQLWYRVGTSYEHEGITGLSHALEHMMFKGTKSRASGEFENILAVNGARNNAFTSQDYTAYYEVIAKDRLEVAMELEADRMRNLVLDEEEFKKEIEVVKEERRWRTDDKPTSLTREQFNAVAFLNSPYRAPVIGWMVDLDTMKLKDLRDWYEKWYAPNNATLVVVGDVEADAIFTMAEKYFGSFKKAELPIAKLRTEVEQRGMRSLVVKAPAKLPHLRMGYKTPGLINAKDKSEAYALEVLANILDGGSSARLAKKLVRGQEIAAGVGAGYYGFGRLPNLFVLTGTPSEGKTVDELKTALLKEIELLKKELVTEQELKRVKAQVVASEVYERDSIEHIASTLGSLESTGLGYQLMDEFVPAILKVTAEQVQQVAKKYLIEDHLTVARLEPQSLETKTDKNNNNAATTKGEK
ncbi:MAG: pitrilysin family protein [Thiotrichaceae bacterium]